MTAKSRQRKSEQTQVITSGTTIRFEEAKSTRGEKSKVATVIVGGSDEFVGGFVNFLREHAVVGLAIGFVIGVQAQALVKQLVTSFIDPAFQLVFGQALSQRSVTFHLNDKEAIFTWGAFANVMVNFLFVLAAVYIIFRLFKLEKLDKPKDDKK